MDKLIKKLKSNYPNLSWEIFREKIDRKYNKIQRILAGIKTAKINLPKIFTVKYTLRK